MDNVKGEDKMTQKRWTCYWFSPDGKAIKARHTADEILHEMSFAYYREGYQVSCNYSETSIWFPYGGSFHVMVPLTRTMSKRDAQGNVVLRAIMDAFKKEFTNA
jgi:hypothetical protein